MANSKLCNSCDAGQHGGCQMRWQSPSGRKILKGTPPRRELYTYRCPCSHG